MPCPIIGLCVNHNLLYIETSLMRLETRIKLWAAWQSPRVCCVSWPDPVLSPDHHPSSETLKCFYDSAVLLQLRVFSNACFLCLLMPALLFVCFSFKFPSYTPICFLWMMITWYSPCELGNTVSFGFLSTLCGMYMSILFLLREVWALQLLSGVCTFVMKWVCVSLLPPFVS